MKQPKEKRNFGGKIWKNRKGQGNEKDDQEDAKTPPSATNDIVTQKKKRKREKDRNEKNKNKRDLNIFRK